MTDIIRDRQGRAFDQNIHCSDSDGNPRITKMGFLRPKPLRHNGHQIDDEISETSPTPRGDNEETIWRRGLLARVSEALQDSTYEESWKGFHINRELVMAAKQVSIAWERLAAFLEENSK